jgi:hypothetical protein
MTGFESAEPTRARRLSEPKYLGAMEAVAEGICRKGLFLNEEKWTNITEGRDRESDCARLARVVSSREEERGQRPKEGRKGGRR